MGRRKQSGFVYGLTPDEQPQAKRTRRDAGPSNLRAREVSFVVGGHYATYTETTEADHSTSMVVEYTADIDEPSTTTTNPWDDDFDIPASPDPTVGVKIAVQLKAPRYENTVSLFSH